MDPVTHAATGAVAMLALSRRPATAWSLPLAAMACASPDLDLLFISSPLEFLLLHRGISHSLAGTPVFGFILALCCWPIWRKSTPGRWKFRFVWLFCIGMILLHIWLDIMTSYGTMIFLPFSHYRVRLNSLYMIDLFILLPVFWAIWRWRVRISLMRLVFAWLIIYPLLGVGLNCWHSAQAQNRFLAENRFVKDIHVLPDAFAPFFWRLLYEETGQEGPTVGEQSLNAMGDPRDPPSLFPAAPPDLVNSLSSRSLDCQVFFNFAMSPIMRKLRDADLPDFPQDDANAAFFMFYDLRFGSGLAFVRKILAMRPDADLPFILMTELTTSTKDAQGAQRALDRIRLRFSDSGRDSGWHAPIKPGKPDFLRWLVGLR